MAGSIYVALAATTAAVNIDQAKTTARRQERQSKKALMRQQIAQNRVREDARSQRKKGEMEQRRLRQRKPGLIDDGGGSGGGLDSTFLTSPVEGAEGRQLGGQRTLGG